MVYWWWCHAIWLMMSCYIIDATSFPITTCTNDYFRIDSNVDEVETNVGEAQKQLVKYLQSISSDRWLMIKIFGVLIFFFLIFVVFLAWCDWVKRAFVYCGRLLDKHVYHYYGTWGGVGLQVAFCIVDLILSAVMRSTEGIVPSTRKGNNGKEWE